MCAKLAVKYGAKITILESFIWGKVHYSQGLQVES